MKHSAERMQTQFHLAALVVCLALVPVCATRGDSPANQNIAAHIHARRPVAAVWLEPSGFLVVGNSASGSLSLINAARREVVCEQQIASSLADLWPLSYDRFLALDDHSNRLLLLECSDHRFRQLAQLDVGPFPASVSANPRGTIASVLGLWSRQAQVIEINASLESPPSLRTLHSLTLPFSPRKQLPLPRENAVVVADAFGGNLALIDLSSGRITQRHSFEGHNLGGLAISDDGQQIHLAHSLLDERTPTTRENITRGTLLAAFVRTVQRSDLVAPPHSDAMRGKRFPLGKLDHGAADPEEIVVLSPNELAIALAGNNEVAILNLQSAEVTARLPTGKRPRRLLARGNHLVCVNELDDSVTFFDRAHPTQHSPANLSLGNRPPPDAFERGAQLFFSARLSADGWMSCHSCHTEGHSCGLLADTRGDNSSGTPKRILTLRGTAFTDTWAWNGSERTLQSQAFKSLEDTMHAPRVEVAEVYDLVSFVHALPFPPPLQPPQSKDDTQQVERGKQIFEAKGCAKCHVPPFAYTSQAAYNVGLRDEANTRLFNPPSLRGVGHNAHFFHDNRAARLEDVFTEHAHPSGAEMAAPELADLVRFLKSL